MASIGNLDIEVGLSVNDETAAACCVLLGFYMSNNPDKELIGKYDYEDGDRKVRYHIEEVKSYEESKPGPVNNQMA